MAKLTYIALTSLDGYIEDSDGRFDWAVPDAEVHSFINDIEADTGTHLYGRRMYETMAVWQTVGEATGAPMVEAQYAEVWRAIDKVVYSRTLRETWTPHTRLEQDFDPDVVVRMKDAAAKDISVSGPGLAQHAFRAGIVDEVHLFVFPVVVGGGKRGLPANVRIEFELLDEQRFTNGAVHLHLRNR